MCYTGCQSRKQSHSVVDHLCWAKPPCKTCHYYNRSMNTSRISDNFLIGFGPSPWKGILAWHYRPTWWRNFVQKSHRPKRGNSDILPNGHAAKLPSKCLCLCHRPQSEKSLSAASDIRVRTHNWSHTENQRLTTAYSQTGQLCHPLQGTESLIDQEVEGP